MNPQEKNPQVALLMRLIVAAVLIYIGIMQFVAMTQGGHAAFSIIFGLLFIGVGGWFVFYAFKSFRRDKDEKGSGEDSGETEEKK